ncbi:MAG: hypothetical protein R3F13_20965 [Prosthecobacter sp.]
MKTLDMDAVREIAMAMPDVTESSLHGAPSFKLRGKLLACPAIHRSAEADTLAVRIGIDQRAQLIVDDPDIYYVTEHYVNHPMVLVRLPRMNRKALKHLLEVACKGFSAK